ncbi:MAG: RluA family pseudouridine synthase [Verrucomicrobiota bacterium]
MPTAPNPLRLIEDHSDWCIVNKRAPLLIHPTRPDGENTLWHELQRYFKEQDLFLVNRLDRETSGLVLVSKNKTTSSYFGRLTMERGIRKRYYAFVHGIPKATGIIDEPIGRRCDFEDSPIYVQQIVHPKGSSAVTEYTTLETRYRDKTPVSLLEIKLHTGRMHQIRVHLKHIGTPVVGDKLYGSHSDLYLECVKSGWNDLMLERLWIRRQALHAFQMEFPWKNEDVRIQTSLPSDLQVFWDGLDLS